MFKTNSETISALLKLSGLIIFLFFKYLIIAIIAAGVTPDILEAAPNVGGFILISFSTISLERLPTFFKICGFWNN